MLGKGGKEKYTMKIQVAFFLSLLFYRALPYLLLSALGNGKTPEPMQICKYFRAQEEENKKKRKQERRVTVTKLRLLVSPSHPNSWVISLLPQKNPQSKGK